MANEKSTRKPWREADFAAEHHERERRAAAKPKAPKVEPIDASLRRAGIDRVQYEAAVRDQDAGAQLVKTMRTMLTARGMAPAEPPPGARSSASPLQDAIRRRCGLDGDPPDDAA